MQTFKQLQEREIDREGGTFRNARERDKQEYGRQTEGGGGKYRNAREREEKLGLGGRKREGQIGIREREIRLNQLTFK